ncbi:DNA-dependent RNA polymerase subunit epsilon [Gemelliphila asaccharolytica]|uniref:RNA polymerase epsilon subunit n=1 Tax=Gemelliphila asaccharolytica TaxID=502393 RepID=A0ABR5TMK3_9BACL|nr:RNA polymerase epsilon subunit [Gemella asaccharolytica]KXB58540.1 hypothetical protein HMPREF1871_00304 [Gemella asaccharolytica]
MKKFKVFYQENNKEIPVRENTKSMFIESSDKPSVLRYLESKNYNVEYVQEMTEEYLNFEKKSSDFKMVKING